jgi:hypothetical protein
VTPSPLRHLRALTRTWQGWVILVVVLAQLVLPLHYYVFRRDPHDERFAWRMFSPMRMAKCTPKVALDDQPLALGKEFHEAWIELAKRGRFVVIERMAERLCAKYPGKAVTIRIDCNYLANEDQTYGGFNMCNVPLL